ncbi:MAG: hypothetical protein COB53_09220 [Elusimicrobia bacterium]|nr:MAG: hypothetical protein COB53_09220 [Elusimicrobiota bacterium]
MARKPPEAEYENAERYLITYADLITLLLGLFIILYVSAEQDTAKYEKMTEAMGSVFSAPGSGTRTGGKSKRIGIGVANSLRDGKGEAISGIGGWGRGEKEGKGKGEGDAPPRLEDSVEQLRNLVQDAHALVILNERGIVVSLKDDLFFDPGSSDFLPEAYAKLAKVAYELKKINNAVRIEGHTDSRPVHSLRYSSNWHLSAARAVETAEFLIETGNLNMRRISIAGYGDTHPIASNKTVGGRRRNRRVEIVILRNPKQNKEARDKEKKEEKQKKIEKVKETKKKKIKKKKKAAVKKKIKKIQFRGL